jgi:3',5'-cyclic AMP phosphodiesterase CpdA
MKTVAHISDIHFDLVDPPVAEALVRDLDAHKPDLLVMSGDFTQRARAGQYQQAADFLKKLPSPQLVVPGNHDIPLWNVFRRFLNPLGQYRKHISPDLRPFYQDDQMLVLGLNTARPFTFSLDGFWKDGKVSEEQLLDIKTRFCEVPPGTFKVLVTHHPFIPPPGERIHGIVRGAQRALAQLETCGCDLLLAGHLHVGYSGDVRTHHEAVKRSMISIQAGTAISTRRRSEPNAYNLITLNPDQVTVQVRTYKDGAFSASVKRDYSRLEGVWQLEG